MISWGQYHHVWPQGAKILELCHQSINWWSENWWIVHLYQKILTETFSVIAKTIDRWNESVPYNDSVKKFKHLNNKC